MTEPKRMSAAELEECVVFLSMYDSQKALNLERHIAALESDLAQARGKALESAALIVDGADVSVNHLPLALDTPNKIAAFLTSRDHKLAAAIRSLKDKP